MCGRKCYNCLGVAKCQQERRISKAFYDLLEQHKAKLGVSYGPSYYDGLLKFWSFVRDPDAPKGNGRIALREVCDLADSLGVKMWLYTDYPRLYSYYESFGFVEKSRSEYSPSREYIREPKQALAMAA